MSIRRHQKFVDFEVQSSLVARLCFHWVVFLATTAITMFFWIRLTEGPTDDWRATWSRFGSMVMPLVLVSLALLPPFILDAVKLSNRFTGPIFRLRKTLSLLAKGQSVRPLEFRSNDFWRGLANDFNKVASLNPTSASTSVKNKPE
jgi:hypothetical protein